MAKEKPCKRNSTRKSAQKIVLERTYSKTTLEKVGGGARGKNRKIAVDRNFSMKDAGTSRNLLSRTGLSVGTQICPS